MVLPLVSVKVKSCVVIQLHFLAEVVSWLADLGSLKREVLRYEIVFDPPGEVSIGCNTSKWPLIRSLEIWIGRDASTRFEHLISPL